VSAVEDAFLSALRLREVFFQRSKGNRRLFIAPTPVVQSHARALLQLRDRLKIFEGAPNVVKYENIIIKVLARSPSSTLRLLNR
jgi:hypothetical protein